MLTNIRIVLVNTSHPGNIGSAARAMKTMGLSELFLVSPVVFPHDKARHMASNAFDVLEKATVVNTLDDAIQDCHLVVGTSARERTIPWPILTPRDFAKFAGEELRKTKIAVMFGREQSGLTNEELERCHYHIQIPASPEYNVLNLAAAVQIIVYELFVASQETVQDQPMWDYPYATSEELESFYEHFEKTMIELDFLNPAVPRQLMRRVRRLFNRARMDIMEVNILRGIFGAISKKCQSKKN